MITQLSDVWTKKIKHKKTNLAAVVTMQRSLLVLNSATSIVAGDAMILREEGLVPNTLPGILQLMAVSPCRFAFQLLKHPIVRFTLCTNQRFYGHEATSQTFLYHYFSPRKNKIAPISLSSPGYCFFFSRLYHKVSQVYHKYKLKVTQKDPNENLQFNIQHKFQEWIQMKMIPVGENGCSQMVNGVDRVNIRSREEREVAPETFLSTTSFEHATFSSSWFGRGSSLSNGMAAAAVVVNETEIHSALIAKDCQYDSDNCGLDATKVAVSNSRKVAAAGAANSSACKQKKKQVGWMGCSTGCLVPTNGIYYMLSRLYGLGESTTEHDTYIYNTQICITIRLLTRSLCRNCRMERTVEASQSGAPPYLPVDCLLCSTCGNVSALYFVKCRQTSMTDRTREITGHKQ